MAADADVEERKMSFKEHNDQLKREKLQRKIRRAHEWRVQVWAQSELKIREGQAGLGVLGVEPVEIFDPKFDDDDMLHHYATMAITK